MTKKKTMKNIKTPNKFNIGGYTKASPIELGEPYGLNTPPTVKPGELIQTWDPNFKPQTGISEFFERQNVKNATGLLGGVAGGLISNGFSTTGGQVLSGIGDAAMMFNPIVGGAIKAASGLVNRAFGTKWNQEGLAKAESQITGLNNFQSGASDYDTLAQDFTRIGSMNKTIKASDLGKDGWFVNRTINKANELNTDLGNAYNYAMRNANNVADNIAGSTLANLERNYAAFGGPIDTAYVNSRPANFVSRLKDENRRYIRDWEDPRFIATHKLGAEYDKNGIPFIYPAVQEINGQLIDFTRPPYTFESGVESAIRNRDTVQMKTLEDAINFTEKYKNYYPKFAYGGQTHGSDFTNGLMFINNGGTHESNPYEGVPISMDQEGNPNLVEEGEVIWNDYVFSNRLKVPKSIQKKYKLGKRELTFANAIDKLSKESEERPNDPISMRGLEDILMHMAIEQETLKSKQQPKNTGKNKFNTGGDTNPYKSYSWIPGYDGGWFDDNGEYTQSYRDYVNAITKKQMLQAFNDNYNYYLNDANKGTDRYNAIAKFYAANPNYNASLTELSDAMFNRSKQLMLDGKPGFMHHVAAEMMNTQTEPTSQTATANRYFIRNADGTATPMDKDLIPFEGLDENGRTWAELNPNYIFRGKQVRPQETIEGVPTTYTDYYYDPKIEEAPKENITTPVTPPENLPTWMRYAPVIGHGALALTDMLGITNKPNYSNAEAIIKASNNLSSNPIKFNPIGDYLTYNPFDTEYHANQLRAVSGATRRNIMNTSRGNRAAALTGILAADNNTMNQMGDLYRKAAEYNLDQRHKVGEFSKDTNKFNSEGFFKADAANQFMRQAGLEGLIKGYAMKEQANLMSDQARAANISGLLTSLGNIGYENANRNMMNWGMATGTWAPSQWKYDPLTGKPVNQNG